MYTLKVKKDLAVKEYIPGDERLFVADHSANALHGLEVRELVTALGDEFGTYFEGADQITSDFIASL